VGADVGEVGIGGGELDDEGAVVWAGAAGELGAGAGLELVIALDQGEVVRDDGRRAMGGGVDDALPASLEGLRVDVLAVVELGAGDQVEGELGGLGVGLPAGGRVGDELAALEVVVGEGVEELVLDLGALVLLRVVGVDALGVAQVPVERLPGARAALGATGKARASERSERARRQAALDKGAAAHHCLINCHGFLLIS
jgi:hypothetical protein